MTVLPKSPIVERSAMSDCSKCDANVCLMTFSCVANVAWNDAKSLAVAFVVAVSAMTCGTAPMIIAPIFTVPAGPARSRITFCHLGWYCATVEIHTSCTMRCVSRELATGHLRWALPTG